MRRDDFGDPPEEALHLWKTFGVAGQRTISGGPEHGEATAQDSPSSPLKCAEQRVLSPKHVCHAKPSWGHFRVRSRETGAENTTTSTRLGSEANKQRLIGTLYISTFEFRASCISLFVPEPDEAKYDKKPNLT